MKASLEENVKMVCFYNIFTLIFEKCNPQRGTPCWNDCFANNQYHKHWDYDRNIWFYCISFSAWLAVIPDIVCQNGGQPNERGKCVCPPPYFGVQCALQCVYGSVIDGICQCDEGYTGKECENGMCFIDVHFINM